VRQPAGWLVETRAGTTSALHEDWPDPDRRARRTLCRCEPAGGPALVVGSAQGADVADAPALARTGTTLVRRRTGGGAVAVAPDAQLWVEAWVPAADALWDADIVRGAFWLGDLWADALARLGVRGAEVHRGRATGGAWSSLLCFAGMGPGEVSVEGGKVVGLAQRRSAAGIRLSSMALVDWRPAELLELLRLSDAERAAAEAELGGTVTGLAGLLPGAGDRAAMLDTVFDAVVAGLLPA
jgi:lipoate-protein ligase A